MANVNLSLLAGAGWQFFDNNGKPLDGGLLYTYQAGTSTPQATYTTSAGNIANSNPIVLDASGRVSDEVWTLVQQSYKFVLKDKNSVLIWTKDNIQGAISYAELANTTDTSLGDALIGYKQSNGTVAYTGAVGSTVHMKLQDWISAFDFGAVGNSNSSGSTGTDDTAAFTALENAVTGAVVNLKNKYYLVSTVPHQNMYINGSFVVPAATTDDEPANFGLGRNALTSNTFIPRQFPSSTLDWAAGNFNTAVGADCMSSNTTGRRNTAYGSQAMRSNTEGYYNTAIGAWNLYSNTTGNYNTSIGNQSMQYNTTGEYNTACGEGALTANTDGTNNVALGDRALQLGDGQVRCIGIGSQAGWHITGTDSVAIGNQALAGTSVTAVSGNYNIGIGTAAMGALTTGADNVAIGRRALSSASTCNSNTVIGNDACVATVVTGSNNTVIGNSAATSLTSGYQNVIIGVSASNTTTTGFNNVFIGRYAAQANTEGVANTAIGEQSLATNTTGNYNTAVGNGAGSFGTTYSNTTCLGYSSAITGSNQLQLGNSSTTSYAYGAVQNRSDERDKTDVRDTELGLNFIKALRPVDYKWDMREDYRPAKPELPENPTDEQKLVYQQNMDKWVEDCKLANIKANGSKTRNRYHHGLIAQEVKAVIEATGVDFGGFQDHSINGGDDVLSIGYMELVAPLIKAVQELSAEIEQLKAQKA